MRILYSGAAPLEADFVATIHTCLQNMVADVVLSQGASTSIMFTLSFFLHHLGLWSCGDLINDRHLAPG